jgi:hypothetical protein
MYMGKKSYNLVKPEKNISINIKKIKEIKGLVKNDYIYINITNLIGNYNFTWSADLFKEDILLKTIVYMLLSNSNDGKNKIIYFTNKNYETNIISLYVYNIKDDIQYQPQVIGNIL